MQGVVFRGHFGIREKRKELVKLQGLAKKRKGVIGFKKKKRKLLKKEGTRRRRKGKFFFILGWHLKGKKSRGKEGVLVFVF